MRRSSDLAPLALLTLWWLLTCVLVGPLGNFPLNDDWSYGTTVRRLVEDGRLQFGAWQSMPMLTHALWGFVFAKLLGFSWVTLRLSSMAAAWLALASFYFLLRGLRWRRWGAFLAAAVLLVNPVFVALSQTFMTDVTFLAMCLVSAACGIWALRQVQTGRFVCCWSVATLAAVMSTLNRQLGVALPLAFGAAAMLLPGRGARPRRAAATFVLVPAVLCLLGLVIYGICRRSTADGSLYLYTVKARDAWMGLGDLARGRRMTVVMGRLVAVLVTLGLFTLPLVLARLASLGRQGLRWGAIGLLAGAAILFAGWRLPLLSNVLGDFGIGPRTVLGPLPAGPRWASSLFTVLAAGAAALLVALLVPTVRRAIRAPGRHPISFLGTTCLGVAVLTLGVLVPSRGGLFDRYVMVLAPLVMAAVPPVVGVCRWRVAVAPVAILLATWTFSVAATHDYLAWHRARMQLWQVALASNIPCRDVEAGFELDNLCDGDRVVTAASSLLEERDFLADHHAARFAITTQPGPGETRVLATIDVTAWLPWSVRTLSLVARDRHDDFYKRKPTARRIPIPIVDDDV
jgi:hypothetical protein